MTKRSFHISWGMERRKRTFFFILIMIGIVLIIFIVTLLSIKPKVNIQLTGASNVFQTQFKGGMKMVFDSVSYMTVRGSELQFESVSQCSTISRLGFDKIEIPYGEQDSARYFLRVKIPELVFLFFRSEFEFPKDYSEMFFYSNNKGLLTVSMNTDPLTGIIDFDAWGNLQLDTIKIYHSMGCPMEIVAWGSDVDSLRSQWSIWFPRDSFKKNLQLDYEDCPRVLIQSFGGTYLPKSGNDYTETHRGSGVVKLIPDKKTVKSKYTPYLTIPIGLHFQYKVSDSVEDTMFSIGRSIGVFKSFVTSRKDSFQLKIKSPLRAIPYSIDSGDSIILKGDFSLKAITKINTMDMQLSGLANSIKLNGQELVPNGLEVYRDWLVALASIIVGISAILGFLGKWFFEWPSKGQNDKPPPRNLSLKLWRRRRTHR